MNTKEFTFPICGETKDFTKHYVYNNVCDKCCEDLMNDPDLIEEFATFYGEEDQVKTYADMVDYIKDITSGDFLEWYLYLRKGK